LPATNQAAPGRVSRAWLQRLHRGGSLDATLRSEPAACSPAPSATFSIGDQLSPIARTLRALFTGPATRALGGGRLGLPVGSPGTAIAVDSQRSCSRLGADSGFHFMLTGESKNDGNKESRLRSPGWVSMAWFSGAASTFASTTSTRGSGARWGTPMSSRFSFRCTFFCRNPACDSSGSRRSCWPSPLFSSP